MASDMPQWHKVDQHTFETEIVPAGRPAVLKGVVDDWPLVAATLRCFRPGSAPSGSSNSSTSCSKVTVTRARTSRLKAAACWGR